MKSIIRLVTLPVAALSCFTVWLIVLFLTMMPVGLYLALAGERSLGIPRTPGAWLAVALSAAVGFYGSFPVARCVGRLFPVRLNGRRRRWLIVACVAVMGLWLGFGVAVYLYRDFLTLVPMTAILLGAATWTLLWQSRSTRLIETPFILYLRRFSSFSDRSVLAALLGARPAGHRAVFLAPLADAPGNFSPIVVAFSGTRLWKPIASCPIPVSARNVEWEDRVEDLARTAECVVIDVSDRSSAIDTEIGIVERCVSPERVVWLADEALTPGQLPESGHIVRYRRSWASATLRILLETLTVLGAAVMVAFSSGNPQLDGGVPGWVFVLAALALVACAAPVIVQPSIRRDTRASMRRALTAILSGSRARRPRQSSPATIFGGNGLCVVLSAHPGHVAFLRDIAERNDLKPVLLARPAGGRSLRDGFRQLKDATLVLADLSQADPDVEYFLGIAHGLGRKVVLVSDREDSPMRGAPVHRLTSASFLASDDLDVAVAAALRDPLQRGPVASLLADEWVFGDRLPGRRTLAFLVDAGLSAGLAFAYLAWRGITPAGVADLILSLFQAGIMALVLCRFLSLAIASTTPGMALMGLRLVDADGVDLRPGQALGRSLAIYLNMLPFSGAWAALFAPRYQTLDDALSDTRVVRRDTIGSRRPVPTREPVL